VAAGWVGAGGKRPRFGEFSDRQEVYHMEGGIAEGAGPDASLPHRSQQDGGQQAIGRERLRSKE